MENDSVLLLILVNGKKNKKIKKSSVDFNVDLQTIEVKLNLNLPTKNDEMLCW
jgi:hypothetical protein